MLWRLSRKFLLRLVPATLHRTTANFIVSSTRESGWCLKQSSKLSLTDKHQITMASFLSACQIDGAWSILIGILGGTALLAAYVKLNPIIVIKFMRRRSSFIDGFKVKKVKSSEGHVFEYMERGDPKNCQVSGLFVHGFTRNKESWRKVIKYLPKDIHVIAFDALGHGNSSPYYKNDWQAESLSEFVDALGSQRKFHLVCQSVATSQGVIFATSFPSHVASLSMLGPAGFHGDKLYERFCNDYDNTGTCVFLNASTEGLTKAIEFVCYKKVILQKVVLDGMTQEAKRNNKQVAKIFQQTYRSQYIVHDLFPKLTMPLLAVYGKHDQLADPSNINIIKAMQPSCETYVIDECGHSISQDSPKQFAAKWLNFVNIVSGTSYQIRENM